MNDSLTPIVFVRGRPANPVGLNPNDIIVTLRGCPDCDGRGWYLINPFATRPSPAGGISNMCQCLTCLSAKEFWDKHGCLPETLVKEMEDKASKGTKR